jgi:acyl-CoA reductase-like NAD-dependent aldehyde dehydrogenase
VPGQQPWPAWVAGEPWNRGAVRTIRDPYRGAPVADHIVPDADALADAVAAAWEVRQAAARLSAADRATALDRVAAAIGDRAEEFARLIVAENGKPIRWARAEVSRAASTFRWAAEEARRFSGQLQRLDTDAAGAGRMALVRRFPLGPVLGIAPFNFPLNLLAHKVAPALAVGAPVIMKPASATPLTALLLGEVLAAADLPAGMWSILPIIGSAAADLVADERIAVLSFTGSESVGFALRDAHPAKQVVLELGGNAAAVIMPDWSSDADLALAAERIATFATYQAGQSCISVQRVFVAESLTERFRPLLAAAMAALPTGDPMAADTVVGPVIDEGEAQRIVDWVAEAVDQGAELAIGGTRDGSTVAPTLLVDAPPQAKVCREEVFGPVVALSTVDGVDAALAAVNDSRFGLQAGIFTHDIATAFRAHAELDVGGVIIGDVPSYRADQMPYGGVKASGVGREGVRSAMHDITAERVLVLTGLAL